MVSEFLANGVLSGAIKADRGSQRHEQQILSHFGIGPNQNRRNLHVVVFWVC